MIQDRLLLLSLSAFWYSYLSRRIHAQQTPVIPSFGAFFENDTSVESVIDPVPRWEAISPRPPQNPDFLPKMLLTFNPDTSMDEDRSMLNLATWLAQSDIVSKVYQGYDNEDGEIHEPNFEYSSFSECKYFYACLYYVLQDFRVVSPTSSSQQRQNLHDCITTVHNSTLVCGFSIESTKSWTWSTRQRCKIGLSGISKSDWTNSGTDENLGTFLDFGPDTQGYWWQGLAIIREPLQETSSETRVWWPEKKQTFSVALGRQALGDLTFRCSLANPCLPDIGCDSACSHIAVGLGQGLVPIEWTIFALSALRNINQQLSNQYVALKGAAIDATLRAFSIQDFYPNPNKHFSLLNVIQGISTALSFVGGFTPGLSGKVVSQASASVGAVGAFFGRSVSVVTDVAQENFAESVEIIYTSLVDGLDNVAERLFRGDVIDGNFSIISMMEGGAWVEIDALERVSNIEEQLRIEILSRSINALWKTAPSNKSFVLFVDLQDDPATTPACNASKAGPQALKYCADGGVYYTYNFIESGEGLGHLGWPWGADKLQEHLKINPAVRICIHLSEHG